MAGPRRARLGQDVGAGALFVAFGALGLWLARDYAFGTALRMGPGYVPTLLCWALIAMGGVIAGRGLLVGDEPVSRWHVRPLVLVLAGLVAFRYLIEPTGLPAAAFATVLLGCAASAEVRPREAVALAAGLAAAAVALFVFALGLPMTLHPF